MCDERGGEQCSSQPVVYAPVLTLLTGSLIAHRSSLIALVKESGNGYTGTP
jgi:hypothetical protein